MQILYVTKFDLSLTSQVRSVGDSPYELALECVARWLTFLAREKFEVSALRVSGSRQLHPASSSNTKNASWEVAGSGDTHAVRLEIRDHDIQTGGVFFTRVTVGSRNSRTAVQISMAREFSASGLTPVPPADVRQPRITSILLDESRLVLSVKGQAQDGRYLQIRNDFEIDELVKALENVTRLPIVLIHTRTLPALTAARTAAAKLVGLVRVVTLDLRSARRLEERKPGLAPPYAGARLVWSDCTVPTVQLDPDRLNGDDGDWLRRELNRRVAPVSALSRGGEDEYRLARQAGLIAHRELSQTRVEEAEASGDQGAQIAALRQQIDSLQEEVGIWEDAVSQAEEELSQLKAQVEQIPFLEQRIEQLGSMLYAPPVDDGPALQIDPWEGLPELQTGSEQSASELFLQVEDLSEQRIVFSKRAAASWKRSKYPYPKEMKDDLVKLARVAMTLYDGSERTMPHLDNWIHTEFELRVALNDEVIEKSAKLRNFIHEGRTYDRTPHVKVRDGVALQHVGRIHFALDSEGKRIVVDHVGIKLY